MIEGDLREERLGLPYSALLSACLNVSLRRDSVLLRTSELAETAAFITKMAEKGDFVGGIPSGLALAHPLSKRKRDCDKHTVFKRQLMVLPSISESIAYKLVEHFDTLPSLQVALRGRAKDFPRIDLGGGKNFGKARVAKLKEYLL